MNTEYCVVVPVYNHYKCLESLTEKLKSLGLFIFLVDDGSEAPAKEAIEKICADDSLIECTRLESNKGKGFAVCKALQLAQTKGFSYAIQIDGDGQYSPDSIYDFIERSKKYPDAVVSGQRNYASMPKSRRYGRMVTDLWVWINTISLQIKDSMCGYRLYPLEQSVALIKNANIKHRMEFDTDILVKLYWSGLDVEHVLLDVDYSEDITSNFNLFRDNARISAMHAGHFFGMLKRIGTLVTRSSQTGSRNDKISS